MVLQLVPYAGKEPGRGLFALPVRPHTDEARDGTIAALWALGLDTYEIAMCTSLRESLVSNRLARLRDGEK